MVIGIRISVVPKMEELIGLLDKFPRTFAAIPAALASCRGRFCVEVNIEWCKASVIPFLPLLLLVLEEDVEGMEKISVGRGKICFEVTDPEI